MIRKYLKKSAAVALTISTMLTGSCISNINAVDTNKEKTSNIKKYLKYTMAYALPCTIALIGGINYGKQLELKTRDERLDLLHLLEVEINLLQFSRADLIKIINNALNRTVKHKKFERHVGKNVMIVKDFYKMAEISTQFFIDNLNKGTKLVFLGNIIGIRNEFDDGRTSLRNIIYLSELQKLYPEQVIILKGQNEILEESKRAAQKYLEFRDIVDRDTHSKKLDDKIEKFIDNLPLICEITNNDKKEEKVCSFSFYATQAYCKEREEISRKCILAGKMRKECKLSTCTHDTIYGKSGFNQKSANDIYNCDDCQYIRQVSIEKDGINLSEIE